MLQLTSEESAELLLVLNDISLAGRPHVQHVRERLEALQPGQSMAIACPSPSLQEVPSVPATPPPQALQESRLEVPTQPKYRDTMTKKDRELCLALHKLRREKMEALYGRAILNNLGPGLIMGDTDLERIAGCAGDHKLGSLEDLDRETEWPGTWEMGEEVLELVQRCRVRDRCRVRTS